MGIRQLEAEILRELRHVAKKRGLRQKDIQEWRTGDFDAREGETKVYLPGIRVWVAYQVKA